MSTIAALMSPKLLELETSNWAGCFVLEMPRGRTNNFPQMWAWPSVKFSSMGNVTLDKRCFRWVHRCRPEDFRRREKVNGRNSVRDN